MIAEWIGLIGLIVGILVAVALLVIAFLGWCRHRLRSLMQSLSAELAISGERVQRGPDSAVYRGGTAGYSRVKGNGLWSSLIAAYSAGSYLAGGSRFQSRRSRGFGKRPGSSGPPPLATRI